MARFPFWDMEPGDELFWLINQLTNERQRRFFMSVAEELLEYNIQHETSYTFGEYFKYYCSPSTTQYDEGPD